MNMPRPDGLPSLDLRTPASKACPACAVEVVRVSAEQMERAHA